MGLPRMSASVTLADNAIINYWFLYYDGVIDLNGFLLFIVILNTLPQRRNCRPAATR